MHSPPSVLCVSSQKSSNTPRGALYRARGSVTHTHIIHTLYITVPPPICCVCSADVTVDVTALISSPQHDSHFFQQLSHGSFLESSLCKTERLLLLKSSPSTSYSQSVSDASAVRAPSPSVRGADREKTLSIILIGHRLYKTKIK